MNAESAEKSAQIRQIALDGISLDGTQTRAGLCEDAIRDYVRVLESGEELDPATVYLEIKTNKRWLSCGFHRYQAYLRAERPAMPCVLLVGDRWSAIENGIVDNRAFKGARITAKDRAYQIELVLSLHPEFADRRVADIVGCSHDTVRRHRAHLETSGRIVQLNERVGGDGRVRPLPVASATEPATSPEGQVAGGLTTSGTNQDPKMGTNTSTIDSAQPIAADVAAQEIHTSDDVGAGTVAGGADETRPITDSLSVRMSNLANPVANSAEASNDVAQALCLLKKARDQIGRGYDLLDKVVVLAGEAIAREHFVTCQGGIDTVFQGMGDLERALKF